MDFDLPPDDHPTRRVVRDWIAANPHPTSTQLAEAGYVVPHWPTPWGVEADPIDQLIIDDELAKAGISRPGNHIGIGWAAPTIFLAGTPEQHERYLPKIFSGEEIWCQLFSEPGSGSDFAGLSSSGVRDGDEWIVNGQKVWTTLAHVSNFGMLLVRTDPDVPKHKGLSYFVLDMHAPGVEVRPLYQMTGEAEFNEVFLTDVRVPDRDRLGAEGEGWRVATTTLMNERVALGGGPAPRGSGPIAELMAVWERRRDQLDGPERAVWRDRVAGLWERAEVVRLTNQRASAAARGGNPGPEGSVAKLASAELNQAIASAVVDLLGAEGMLHEPGYPLTRSAGGMASRSGRFLRSRANTIEGGTSEIMRNILGERVLGLPGDVRVDKDVPWNQIPR